MSESLDAEWRNYRDTVIASHAPPAQIRESRRAFYAGAAAVFDLMLGCLRPDAEAHDDEVARLDAIHAELRAFGDAIRERRA